MFVFIFSFGIWDFIIFLPLTSYFLVIFQLSVSSELKQY